MAQVPSNNEMLDAGVHYGHQRRKWNPKMRPYIFTEAKGIHIIDLNKTAQSLETTGHALRALAKSGKKILFVATKKQAKDIVQDAALSVNMPFVTDRWLGGMMTNFNTIRKSVKKMKNIEKMLADTSLTSITKKERLTLDRERTKMERVFGGIANLNRLPHAVFIIDTVHEHLALAEARRLGIRTFGMVDTNSDPTKLEFPIPANDDSRNSIKLIMGYVTDCIKEGQEERNKMKKEVAAS